MKKIEIPLTVDTIYEEMKYIVREVMGYHPTLVFSIYDASQWKSKDMPISMPDLKSTNPVIEGKCIFFTDYWRIVEYTNPPTDKVESDVIENPTWKDILIAVDKIISGGDGFGVYFEGLYLSREENGIKYIDISIGS